MRLSQKVISLHVAALILCLTLPVLAATAQESASIKPETDPTSVYASQVRDKIKGFAGELMQELQAALAKGSPPEAISVCSAKAPEIANRISRQTGWMVRRVSLKTRNPLNLPDEYEAKTLRQLESLGEQKDEASDIVTIEGRKEFRYLKVIRIAAACLKCHGPADQISPDVKDKLKTLYPYDTAIGYQLGEIRGAFSVRMPLD